jgi:sugar phosphate isomerase/epimerase
MANAIVGYTGFVGSNLLQFYKFDYFYNSKNFDNAKNKTFDTMFFCGIPAVKWYANKNPQEDYNVIENIKSILNTIKVKKIILISTIDVYECVDKCYDENYEINPNNNHTYGKNRFLFEEYVIKNFENYNIIRLPALFGKGLKKNIIYDLMHNNNIHDIPFNSSFQWYNLDWLKGDIDIVLNYDIKICNFFTEPVHTKKIVKVFEEIYKVDYTFKIDYLANDNTYKEYNTCTKYSKYFDNNNKYIKNENDVLNAIKEYLSFEKINKSNLSVSNICLNNISHLQFACLLKLYGIKNVQIAPTKLINTWDKLDTIDLEIFKRFDINVSAFQSITFTLNNLNIFDLTTQKELYQHLIKVIDCAEIHKVKTLVFGCPRNRKVLDLDSNNNMLFIDFFKMLGNYLEDKNLIICLENNSKEYNCNFINTIKECSNLVRSINKKNIKMMVDLGNAIMEKDEWYYLKNDIDIIYNIDISQPYMIDFSNPHISHEIFNLILKNCNYNKIINLEMLIKDEDEIFIICKSLNNFIHIYGIPPH